MEQKFFTGKFLFSVLLVLGMSNVVFGYPGGVSGYTKTGCSCHSTSATTAVIVTIAGPSTLAVGATGTYTVTIANSGTIHVGVDISASAGTLAPAADALLQVMSSELTHKANHTATGSYVFNFKYTAPATATTATLYAAGAGTSSSKPGWNFSPNFNVTVTAATAVDNKPEIAKQFQLMQNYPNPFNPSTTINYEIPQNSFVTLKVYDVSGKEVKTLVNQSQNSGQYKVQFNAGDLVSGVYVYRLTAGNLVSTRKLILTK